MEKSNSLTSSKLAGRNASEADVYQPWELDNQAWWDWYVTLAEKDHESKLGIHDVKKFDTGVLLSLKELKSELNEPYYLNAEQKSKFSKNGFIKIKNMLSENAVFTLNNELSKLMIDQIKQQKFKKSKFLSMDMLWIQNSFIKEFVLSPRIGKTISELLNVKSVRLYHDNVLIKRPDCGRTPWHYDMHHFPLATKDVVTAWIPAQPIPRSMGPLSFAMPIDVYKLVENIEFSKFDSSYDEKISKIFKNRNIQIESGSFEIGEISFHHNLCFHSAGSNKTSHNRMVLANTYFANGSKVVEKPTMVSGDWQKFIPDTKPGEKVSTPLNPICWPKANL